MFHFKPFILTVCLLLLVAGCVSPEQRAYNQQMQAREEQQQREAYREQLASSCDRIGFKRGTDAHANCILSQYQANQQQAMQLLMQMGQQERRPTTYDTNCTRDSFGNTRCTTAPNNGMFGVR